MLKMNILGISKSLMLVVSTVILVAPGVSLAEMNVDSDILKGVSVLLGGESDVDVKICPQGARVVDDFLRAWRAGDYVKMYELVDDESKADYSFEQAKFDFQFMEYEPYKISSLRAAGDNFEFILRCGDYKDNNIKMTKLLISGTSFKILKASKNSIFKRSVEDYM